MQDWKGFLLQHLFQPDRWCGGSAKVHWYTASLPGLHWFGCPCCHRWVLPLQERHDKASPQNHTGLKGHVFMRFSASTWPCTLPWLLFCGLYRVVCDLWHKVLVMAFFALSGHDRHACSDICRTQDQYSYALRCAYLELCQRHEHAVYTISFSIHCRLSACEHCRSGPLHNMLTKAVLKGLVPFVKRQSACPLTTKWPVSTTTHLQGIPTSIPLQNIGGVASGSSY